MIIEGVNLMRTKRAYIAYLEYCTQKIKSAPEADIKEYWNPEMEATEALIKAVEQNIKTENTREG